MQLHRWIGLILLILLIPLSASGSLLVWDEWTDGWVNPQRYQVTGTISHPVAAYVGTARTLLDPNDRVASISFPAEDGKPLVLTASSAPNPGAGMRSGPPSRTQVWLDPAGGRVLDHATGDSGLLRVLHRFHGSLMIPDWGRPAVGWLGVAMLISSLTGLWLWLPVRGSIRNGFQWKRAPSLSGRLHLQFGFWIAIPLAILAFTGAYISFPTATRSLEALFGVSAPARSGPSGPSRAAPAASNHLDPDTALAAAQLDGASLVTLRWPTEKAAEWTITVDRAGRRSDIIVDDITGKSRPAAPPAGAARFMRMLHDGTGYNPVWQTILFVAGLVPALLGTTGLLMWLRGRRVRRQFETSQPAAMAEPA